MRARLRGAEPAVLFVFLASLALVIPGVLVPVFSRVFVDQILVRSLQDWLVPLLLGMGLTALLRAALSALQVRALLRARTRLAIDGARATLWRLLRLPTLFFSQRFAGELADRLDLNDGVAALLTGELAQAVLGLITATFFLFFLGLWHAIAGFGALRLRNWARYNLIILAVLEVPACVLIVFSGFLLPFLLTSVASVVILVYLFKPAIARVFELGLGPATLPAAEADALEHAIGARRWG